MCHSITEMTKWWALSVSGDGANAETEIGFVVNWK